MEGELAALAASGVPLERKGMKVVEVFTKRFLNAKPQRAVRILCPCGDKFVSSLSRWRNHLMDSCKKCALQRSKNYGFQVFAGGKRP